MATDPGLKLLTFQELGLSFGQTLQILPNPGDKNFCFDCQLIGCLSSESIIIGPNEAGILPRVVEGQKIVVRVNLPGGIALFPTTVLFVSDMPTIMVYLDYPRDVKFKQIRGALRANVTLPILANNANQPELVNVAGKIVDISTTGAGLEMYENLGELGDLIEIKGKFGVGDIVRTISLQAEIKVAYTRHGQRCYGVHFNEADEDKLLVLLGFVFRALALGPAQTIR